MRFVLLLFGAVQQRHRADGDCSDERAPAIDGQSNNHEGDNDRQLGDVKRGQFNDSEGGDGAADNCDDIGFRRAASRSSKWRDDLQSADGHAEHLDRR